MSIKNVLGAVLLGLFGFFMTLTPIVKAEDANGIFTKEEMNITDDFITMFNEMPIVKTLMLKVVVYILVITGGVALVMSFINLSKVITGKVETGGVMYVAKPILWWLAGFFILVFVNGIFILLKKVSIGS